MQNNQSQMDQKNNKQRNGSGRIQSAKSGIYRSSGKREQQNYSNSKYEAEPQHASEIQPSQSLTLQKNKSAAQHSSYNPANAHNDP
jgi:hypothetical protein